MVAAPIAADVGADDSQQSGANCGPAVTSREFFFEVRDCHHTVVMKALAGGLGDPFARLQPQNQDLMFFAAARSQLVGGADVIARRLAALGVPSDSVDNLWQTPLFYAAREGNLNCAMLLVGEGCNVNQRDIKGQTAIFYAVRHNRTKMVRYLLSVGASLEEPDSNGMCPNDYNSAGLRTRGTPGLRPDNRAAGAPGGSSTKATSSKAIVAGGGKRAAGAVVVKRAASDPPAPAPVTGRTEGDTPAALPPRSAADGQRPDVVEISPLAKRRRLAPIDSEPIEVIATPDPPQRTLTQAMERWVSGLGEESESDYEPRSKAVVVDPSAVAGAAGLASDGPGPLKVTALARAGEYYVCVPGIADVPRLRELERQFVADHAEVLRSIPGYSSLTPADWCGMVNVIHDETSAHQAISGIVQGKTPKHATLQCVHKPKGRVPLVVGYVHLFRDGGDMDVSHLKVDREHQGIGLGGMLLAGALRSAERDDWDVHKLRLVVVARNRRALKLYTKLGFQEDGSTTKRLRGNASVDWIRMTRVIRELPESYAAKCEERVIRFTQSS